MDKDSVLFLLFLKKKGYLEGGWPMLLNPFSPLSIKMAVAVTHWLACMLSPDSPVSVLCSLYQSLASGYSWQRLYTGRITVLRIALWIQWFHVMGETWGVWGFRERERKREKSLLHLTLTCSTSWFCQVRRVPGSTYFVDPGTTFLSKNLILTIS